MPRFLALLALFLSLATAPLRAETAATAITLEGQVQVESGDTWASVALGQLLGAGDHLRTGEASSLHLILSDGSSLVLGPNTELTLKALGGEKEARTLIQLFRGALHAIVEKLTLGSSFEVQTANAVAAVKGTEFEVEAAGDESAVTVAEGEVQLGDLDRKRFEPVRALERRRFSQGRLLRAERLAKRDSGAFLQRLERHRGFHRQGPALRERLRANTKEHRDFERQIDRRRERRERMERLRKPSGEAKERRLERLREARERRETQKEKREKRKSPKTAD